MKHLLYPFKLIYFHLFYGKVYIFLIKNIPFFRPVYETIKNESPISLFVWIRYKFGLYNGNCYWPVHPTSTIRGSAKNIYVGIDAAPGISPGCYIQAIGKIFVEDYAQIAPNVGLISANHFMFDIRKHNNGEIRIGKYCRIGMGSIIMPGVTLGDFTTVSAGSIVYKSFPDGYCVIGGNPAVMIQDYSKNEKIKSKFFRYKNDFEYNGFIKASKFETYRKNNLNL